MNLSIGVIYIPSYEDWIPFVILQDRGEEREDFVLIRVIEILILSLIYVIKCIGRMLACSLKCNLRR